MPRLLSRYATPLITGLFLVSLVSGTALFFHVGPSGFHGMHEWLSMVLILPFVFHLWKNWKPMKSYLRHAPMAIALVASLAAALVFLYPASANRGDRAGGPPQFAFAHKAMAASVAEMAPVLDMTPEALQAKLTAAGFAVAGSGQTLTDIAAASQKSEAELVSALTRE